MVASARSAAQSRQLLVRDPAAEFSRIYAGKLWSAEGGGSGGGSTMEYTRGTREVLHAFLVEHKIRTMVDAPCGSFHWMPALLHRLEADGAPLTLYTGMDVVSSVIEPLAAAHVNSSSLRFEVKDLTRDALPGGQDLVMSRDALQHLSLEQVKSVLRAFKAADPLFLLVGSYPFTPLNVEIQTGDYQGVNLMAPPFSLWPMEILNEHTPDHKHLLMFTQEQIRLWMIE